MVEAIAVQRWKKVEKGGGVVRRTIWSVTPYTTVSNMNRCTSRYTIATQDLSLRYLDKELILTMVTTGSPVFLGAAWLSNGATVKSILAHIKALN